MLISVIIPAYNGAKFISECIESLLHQTLAQFEGIIVDDGSIDNTSEICQSYSLRDKRIKLFLQKHEGVAVARNLGLSQSMGKYICFLDADDLLYPTSLEDLYNARTKTEADLIIGGYNNIKYTSDVTDLPYKVKKYSIADYLKQIQNFSRYKMGACWGKLYLNELIKYNNIKFDTLFKAEDTLFNIEYLKYVKNIAILPRTVYQYLNRNINSLSKNFCNDYVEIKLNVLCHLIKLFKIHNLSEKNQYTKNYFYQTLLFGDSNTYKNENKIDMKKYTELLKGPEIVKFIESCKLDNDSMSESIIKLVYKLYTGD